MFMRKTSRVIKLCFQSVSAPISRPTFYSQLCHLFVEKLHL